MMRCFIGGSDTEVGKTEITVLLIEALREAGIRVGAVKPFCSGPITDLERLANALGAGVDPITLCWRHVPEPVAPYVAIGMRNQSLDTQAMEGWVAQRAREVDILLIEGIGGLLTPLDRDYTNVTMAKRAADRVILVVPNVLGSLNGASMAGRILELHSIRDPIWVFNDRDDDQCFDRDQNYEAIQQLEPETCILRAPYLVGAHQVAGAVKLNRDSFKKALAASIGFDNFFFPRRDGGARE